MLFSFRAKHLKESEKRWSDGSVLRRKYSSTNCEYQYMTMIIVAPTEINHSEEKIYWQVMQLPFQSEKTH